MIESNRRWDQSHHYPYSCVERDGGKVCLGFPETVLFSQVYPQHVLDRRVLSECETCRFGFVISSFHGATHTVAHYYY